MVRVDRGIIENQANLRFQRIHSRERLLLLLTTFGIVATGFLLGLQHSFEPDHLAAICTLTSEERSLRKSIWIGAAWGGGHTMVLLIAGILSVVFKLQLSEAHGRFFEFIVGVMLFYLGIRLFMRIYTSNAVLASNFHPAAGIKSTVYHQGARPSRGYLHRPVIIGMIHGFAGSAGIVLLITASIQAAVDTVAFVLLFGLGSILGMMFSGSIVALPLLSGQSRPGVNRAIMTTAATLSFLIGCKSIYDHWLF